MNCTYVFIDFYKNIQHDCTIMYRKVSVLTDFLLVQIDNINELVQYRELGHKQCQVSQNTTINFSQLIKVSNTRNVFA